MDPASEWMNTSEVADMTRIAEGTLRYWKHASLGPRCYKVGRRVLYKRADVLAWMENCAVEPSGPARAS